MRKTIAIFILASLVLSSCGKTIPDEASQAEAKNVKAMTVTKDYFTEDIKLIGKVTWFIETPISAQAWGAIKEVRADVGKRVKAGDVLAVIDLNSTAYKTSFMNASNAYENTMTSYEATEASIKNDLESARVSLENAKTARDNTYATTERQAEITQTQFENVKTTKQNTELTTKESLNNAKLVLKNAQTSLENFEKNSKASLDTLRTSINVATRAVIATSENSLTQADVLLGVTDKNKFFNDGYETYLGARDTKTKMNAESSFLKANSEFQKLKALSGSTDESIESRLDVTLTLVDAEVSLFQDIIDMLNNTLPTTQFAQAQIDASSWNMSKFQTAILAYQTQLNTLKSSLSQTKTQIETQRLSLENALTLAQGQLSNIEAGNNSQLDSVKGNEILTQNQLDNTYASIKAARDSADNAVKIAQAQFDSTSAKLESLRATSKAQLDNARWGKDLAKIQLDNTKIVAPFDGVITARNVEVGGLVNPGVVAFSIGDDAQIKIKLDINADTVSSIKLWQEASVRKWTQSFTGMITLLSPAADPNTKMYKAEVSFAKKPAWFTLWEYVDAYLSKRKEGEKVLMVPYSALLSLGQGSYSLFVIGKDGKVKEKSVKLWEQNSTSAEILAWITEWEKVVVSWNLSLHDGDTVRID